ncbi:L,D-transpeptidase [Brevibacterium litoralis]|uniref:L,D-transpeptidase n=1 Tax=Brevibacterium litoralis TaxID=3138935 RepID=UPI0032EB2AA9
MFRRPALAAALAAGVLALSACTADEPTDTDTAGADTGSASTPLTPPSEMPAPEPEVSLVTADGTQDVGADPVELEAGDHLELVVAEGEFTSVELVDTGNDRVPTDTGVLSAVDPAAEAPSPTDTSAPEETDEPDTQALDATTSLLAATSTSASNTSATTDSTPGPTVSPTEGAEAEDTEGASGAGADTDTGTHWISAGGLAGDKEYAWTATVLDGDGEEHEVTGSVTTAPASGTQVRARSVTGDDAVVGVGAPIVIDFSAHVEEEYRDDVEARLAVETRDSEGADIDVTGSWAWLPDHEGKSRIHYRTEEYWPAYTEVSVSLPFGGVQFGTDTQGTRDMTLDFEIGREQIVEASAATKRMVVTRDGEEIWDWPASLGMPEAPSYNGPHIVMAKAAEYTMTSERWGYETDTRWAVRIHNNGEFVHGAPWSASSHGVRNVSHGCINLTNERAYEYYQSAIYGDPVIISDSSVDLTPTSGEVSDWVYEWDAWTEMSALPQA